MRIRNLLPVLISLPLLACSGTSDLGGDLFGDASGPSNPKAGDAGGLGTGPDTGVGGGQADAAGSGDGARKGDGAPQTNDASASSRMRLFVTAAGFNGDLRTAGGAATGLAGGDKLCALSAASAGLGGTWVAWLSDSTTDALSRVADASPWYLVNRKTLLFPTKASLSLSPLQPISIDERGNDSGRDVWTGTAGGGLRVKDVCSDWTSASSSSWGQQGIASSVSNWTAFFSPNCASSAQLYCLEQP